MEHEERMNSLVHTVLRASAGRLFRWSLLPVAVVLLVATGGCEDSFTHASGVGAISPDTSRDISGDLYFEQLIRRRAARYNFAAGTTSYLFSGGSPSLFPSGEFAFVDRAADALQIMG